MFKEIPDLLQPAQVEALRRIAAGATFVDGRVSNPHSKVKHNLQLHEANAYQQAAQILLVALRGHEDFNNFAFPTFIAPPMLTRYGPGMRYGNHYDAAFIRAGNDTARSDLSCTIFINDPDQYEGGALCVHLGTKDLRFRGRAGSAIVYPSDSLHEVEPVTSGERLVAISFIQSRVRDPFHRDILYEVSEVAALEGLNMSYENMTRLQRVHHNLLRAWSE